MYLFDFESSIYSVVGVGSFFEVH